MHEAYDSALFGVTCVGGALRRAGIASLGTAGSGTAAIPLGPPVIGQTQVLQWFWRGSVVPVESSGGLSVAFLP